MPLPERIRHASLYMDGEKVAECSQSEYGIASGDESQIADSGYFGHSDGAETTTLSFDTIEPVRPSSSTKIRKALRNKTYVEMSVALISGAVEQVWMRAVKANYTSDAATGKLNGKFEFEGGAAEIVGEPTP
jgi:hypothetical protein